MHNMHVPICVNGVVWKDAQEYFWNIYEYFDCFKDLQFYS